MSGARLLAWLRRRITPGGYFGLELTAGAVVFIAAAWAFGGLAEDVHTGEPITQVDARIAQWFHVQSTAGMQALMAGVSWFHTWPIGLLAGAFLVYLLSRRQWMWALFGSTAVLGGMLLNTLLKLAFHRTRPSLSGLSTALNTYSFPSGHTMAATVLYGVLAAYAIGRVRSLAARLAIAISAVLIVALVAFSRIYLGVHYLSDVLAAAAEGIAWLALSYAAAYTLVLRWDHRPSNDAPLPHAGARAVRKAWNERRIRAIFRASVALKGVHGLLECAGGLLFAFVGNSTMAQWVNGLTQHELLEDPQDVIATNLAALAHSLSASTQSFYAFYLLTHGAVKLVLVGGLLTNRLWAYPFSIVAFALFIVYQLYRFSYTHAPGLIALTILDLVVVGLIWHEYRLMQTSARLRQ